MNEARCEPPEELRGVDGWHWVETPDGRHRFCHRWWKARGEWGWATLDERSARASRYLAPVTHPAEVEALRAEISEWCQKAQLFEDVAQRRKNERDAIAIAFRKLSTVLRVNMLRHGPEASHAEIDAAIDACLGPVARAALEDKP